MKRGAALLWLVCACADTGPAGPTTTVERALAAPDTAFGIVPGSIITIVSGETGLPVAGARLSVAGKEHVANVSGQISLSDLAPNDATIDIQAAGFLDRQTLVRREEHATFELWPTQSPTRLDAEYTRILVYTSASLHAHGELEALDHPSLDHPNVAIVPTGPIGADDRAMASLRAAAAEMTRALDGALVYRVGDSSGAMAVTVRVDPNDDDIVGEDLRAFTRCWLERLTITRCEIVYRDVDVVRSDTTLHELGHTFGLNHSPDRTEIMGVRRVRLLDAFSPREELAMRLMLKRRPGNLFPDNDRQAPAQRVAGATSVIVCRHP